MGWLVSAFVRCSWVLFIFLFVPIMAQSVLSQGLSDNAPPQFVGSTNLTLEEHGVLNHTLTVEDADPGDSVTGYEFYGSDAGYFFFNESTGVLSMNISPDFERPVDSDRNNLYEVDVRAYSGTGGRKLNSSAVFTVNVTDKRGEVPGPPRMWVSHAGFQNFVFSWGSPVVNTGPGVNRYQAQTLRGSSVTYSGEFPSPIILTAGGAVKNTLYKVRVRARNADGWGSWTTLSVWTDDCDKKISGNTCSLSLGVNRTGRINAHYFSGGNRNNWDHDWFSVDLEAGVEYQIDVKGNESTDFGGTLDDPIVKLFNSSGGAIDGTEDDNSGYGKNARMNYTPEVNGTYYVDVSSITPDDDSGEGKTYTVFVRPSNVVATGRVGILGRAVAGATLTADTSGISDGNGLVNALFRYKWIRVDGGAEEYISGATERTYTTVDADRGKKLKVEVSFTDDYFYSEGPFVSDVTQSVVGALVSNLDQDNSNARPISDNYNRASAQKFGVGSTSILEKIVMPIATFSGSPNVSVSIHHVGSDSYPGGKLYSLTGNVNSAGTWNFTAPANALLNASEYFLVFRMQGGSGSFTVRSTLSTAEDSGAADGWSIGNVRYYTHDGRKWRKDGLNLKFAVYGEVRDTVVNNPPVFSSGSNFSVNENNRAIGTVVASDRDSLDNVTGYSISDSFDNGRFSITSDGVFTFRSAPNFESPYGRSNVYGMIVTATSGTGGRVRTTAQGVTVTVVDVDEAPSAPSAPVLSSPSSTSLLVGWSVPSNTGPAISDYDVGYGRNSNGPFTDWQHSGTSRSATITGLNASTLYFVRVRARNAEGVGSWSPTANFTTGPPPGTNNPPIFTSNSSFSVNENTFIVGTVVASDRDSQDSVTGYRVSGGVDSARFSITNVGVLSFVSAPDYESPADSGGDNVYDLVVTATSGAGGRVRTANQSVVVTVVDVVEVPSNVTSLVGLSQDFGNLSSAGNNDPRGIWSSGGVMYVVDSDDYWVYAYNLSTKDFIPNQSFDLSSVDAPWGIWSDDETVWVALEFSSSNDYVDAYDLSYRIHDSFDRDPAKDFSMPNADFSPRGIWSDGVTMWIVQEKGNLSYVDAYKMSDASSDSGKNFNLTGGHDSPGGVWSDGVTMWIVDLDADVVRAYNLSSGSYDSGKDFSLTSENSDPTGIWFDNETVWVADSVDDKIYSYSRLVAPVVNSPATGRPTIIGTVQVGRVLTVGTSGISDGDGVPGSFSYQWVRVDGGTETDILGATGSNYTVVSDDKGKRLKVEVSFTDNADFSEGPLASDATVLVPAPVNNPPVFSSSSSFSVNENTVSVGTVVASDIDGEDSVSGYRVSGGVDSALFSITSGGVLTFVSAPDFEVPVDVGGDNVYDLVVTVTSGVGGRELSVTQSVVVTVVDVDEVPSAPSAPGLSSPSSTSLLVGWSAPLNTGPVISDYDVGYGRNSNGPFTDWPHSDASRSAIITGLNASTLYYVRVRAGNAEGNSSWSPTASFTTGSPPVNNPPVFSSSSSFSVNENVRGVGTVVASDLDNRDAVSGYVVSGGVDSARFSITRGGVLSFRSAPDFEVPVDSGGDNVYDLVVTATSGAGGRVRNATQSISVTVNDVVEAPSAPSAPVLSSPSSTSLSVSWSAPSNKGPPISDYDVGYGRSLSGPFTNWSHSGTSRSATITGLSPGTLYFVRVLARNVEGSSGWSPTASFTTGSTSVPNNPPVFSGDSSSTTIRENSVDVGVVGAVDIDPRDDVTGYSVGGVDSAFFSITDYGELTFSSAPDFESPVDSGGDNVYNVVVTAASGTGSRVRTATHNVTVTVRDVDEAPSAPSAPVLSSPSSTSLSVSWFAPLNTGPAISDYDVEYRQGTSGSFSGWPHSGTGTSATITGLDASTLYQVQVRAGNDEGNSSWSEVSNFTTGSVSLFPPPNNPPVFSSSSSFSVNENNRAVGTVVASDPDNQDGVSGYSVSSGADSARFSITDGGELTFRFAPDYESPADSGGNNVYNLVVTATSGAGGRVRTATQSITVTVNDVVEGPVGPPVVLVYSCG